MTFALRLMRSQNKWARARVPFFKDHSSCYLFISLREAYDRLLRNSANVYFAKLATASASLLYTSNTVSNLVICSTSWNLLPRCASFNAAPCDFAL
jgi:hypothetical protein